METEFQPKGQSINDIVAREVQKEVSKLQTATPSGAVKQSFGKTDSRGPRRKKSRSNSRSRNASALQDRRSRSKTRSQNKPHKHKVTFSGSRSPYVQGRQASRQRRRKIDQRKHYTKWLDKIVKRKTILDLLPSLEFHNHFNVTLTATQSRTLGLDLKFRFSFLGNKLKANQNTASDNELF